MGKRKIKAFHKKQFMQKDNERNKNKRTQQAEDERAAKTLKAPAHKNTEKNYSPLIIGGGKRTHDGDDEISDSYEDPPIALLQTYRQILLFSEGKHKTVQDLYLNDDQVDALICGVAAFVGRKGIRKVAVLPSTFSDYLSIHNDANPINSLAIYKSNFDILLAPIASGGHWYLAAFYVHTKIVVVYDSLHWPVPSIFPRLKKCIESVLHIQFTLKNRNYTVTKQQNGYDCGVNCFRNAEEICFHGECKLFDPYYPEAERARAREIFRRLKNKEITDEWVPHVVTPTHYTNLNKPADEAEKEEEKKAKSSDDGSDIEILDQKKTLQNIVSTTDKKDGDAKKDETNICDESIGCLNDAIKKTGIDDSMEIEEDKRVLTDEEENETQQKIDENFIDYCNRKRIRKDSDARKEFNAEKNAAKAKLAENEKIKATNLKVCDNYKEKQHLHLWKKSSNFSSFSTHEKHNDDFIRWKETFPNASNNSTISLHIVAYENSLQNDSSYLFGEKHVEGLKKQSLQTNYFEFPRQQDGDRPKIPEIDTFKTSQDFMGSSRRPQAMDNVLQQLSSEDDVKMIRAGDRFHRVLITTHIIRCNVNTGYKFLTCSVKSSDEIETTKTFGIKAWSDSMENLKVDSGDVVTFKRLLKQKPKTSTPSTNSKSNPSTPSSSKREYIPKPNELKLDLWFTKDSSYSIVTSANTDTIQDLQLITGPLAYATVIVQIDRQSDAIDGKYMILGRDSNTIFIELWSPSEIPAEEGSTWKFCGKVKIEGGILMMDVKESSKCA